MFRMLHFLTIYSQQEETDMESVTLESLPCLKQNLMLVYSSQFTNLVYDLAQGKDTPLFINIDTKRSAHTRHQTKR